MTKKTILTVDDDPNIRDYLEAVFTDNGYNVVLAENGDKALEILKDLRPDLITLDVEMPDKSGPWVGRAIQKNSALATIPIVVITGHSELSYIIPKAAAFLAKPFEADEVVRVVRGILGE